jgi:hypothetical protein
MPAPTVALVDLAVRSATILPHVDTLEVLLVPHKYEQHVRSSRNCTASDRLHYPDALQKFRTRTSSGNSVIYNSNFPGLRGGNFFIASVAHLISLQWYQSCSCCIVGSNVCVWRYCVDVDQTLLPFHVAVMVV